ncbi:Unknown protein [Striga hermonthica]|uniref:Uncharacterized protein n=1 Tax=Striga hermonthica TaxID=68872 RepID=A0A9N7MN97_STRHE|nr:Unknown protein [Striga hermonthica]
MENGNGIAEHAKVGENNGATSEVVEQPVNEDVTLSLDASKEPDGDEVFEEAAEADPTAVRQENSPKADGNTELSGTLKENNKDDSDLVHEVHEVKDVTGAPDAIHSSEDAVVKPEILKGEENHGEKEFGVDVTNGFTGDGIADSNDSAKEDVRNEYSGIVDSPGTTGETENEENSDGSNENSVVNISGKKSFLEALTSGGAKSSDTESVGEPIVEKLRYLETNESSRPETDSEKLDVETYYHELVEAQDTNIVEGVDIGSVIPENGSLDHVNLSSSYSNHEHITDADAAANVLKEQNHETSQGIGDGRSVKETGADLQSESDSNGDALHKNGLNAISSTVYEQDMCDNKSANLQSELKEDQVDEQVERPHVPHANTSDDSTEPKKLDSESAEVEKADGQDVDHEQNHGTSAPNVSVSNHAKESLGLDTNSHPALDNRTPNVEQIEAEPPLSSSGLSSKNFGSSQPELISTSNEISANTIEGKIQEGEGAEGERKEVKLSGNKEKEATLVTGGISSISDLNNVSMKEKRQRGSRANP